MHKHYIPNRTTEQIQQDLAFINSLDRSRPRNKRRKTGDTLDIACKVISALLYAGCATGLIYVGMALFKTR